MLDAFVYLLCSKPCWHNPRTPSCDILCVCVYIMFVMKLSSEQASSNDYDLVAIVKATLLYFTLCGILLGMEALKIICLFVHTQKCVLCMCVFISIASHYEVQLN